MAEDNGREGAGVTELRQRADQMQNGAGRTSTLFVLLVISHLGLPPPRGQRDELTFHIGRREPKATDRLFVL